MQGIVVCGVCGERMTIGYHGHNEKSIPDYVCQRETVSYGTGRCQTLIGNRIDKAISELLLDLIKPMTLELASHVQHEVQTRLEEADAIHRQSIERAQYEAELAHKRFMSIDPRNRLFADQLEADWNEKLREAEQARQRYEEQAEKDRVRFDDDARQKILSLAKDFPRIWNDPDTTYKQRKRMIRLLIEDVTLTRAEKHVRVQIRLQGGQTKTLEVPLSLSAPQMRKTPEQTIVEIDRVLDHYTEGEIVQQLNQRGITSSMGCPFSAYIIGKLHRSHHLATRYERLRKTGLLTKKEIAHELDVNPATIAKWYAHGLLVGYDCDDSGVHLFEMPDKQNCPTKSLGKRLTERSMKTKVVSQATNKVQHEA